jgi:hypothetical protein
MGKIKNLLIEAMETPIMDACAECQGSGMVEVDVVRPQGFGRDVGVIDGVLEDCSACGGVGEVERLCACGEWVTSVRGDAALVCEECV